MIRTVHSFGIVLAFGIFIILFTWISFITNTPAQNYEYKSKETRIEIVNTLVDEKTGNVFAVKDSEIFMRNLNSLEYNPLPAKYLAKAYYNIDAPEKYYLVKYSTSPGKFIPWGMSSWVILVERR